MNNSRMKFGQRSASLGGSTASSADIKSEIESLKVINGLLRSADSGARGAEAPADAPELKALIETLSQAGSRVAVRQLGGMTSIPTNELVETMRKAGEANLVTFDRQGDDLYIALK